MVVGICMLLKHLSFCWKFWSCSCFIIPWLLLCASLLYFLIRFLCIGSGLDLSVLYIFFLMLSYCFSILILMWASSQNYWAYLNGYKERALGRQPLLFLLSVFVCFLFSFELFSISFIGREHEFQKKNLVVLVI